MRYQDLVKTEMARQGITAYKLAKDIGMAQPAMSALMSDRPRQIKWDTLTRIADGLNCDVVLVPRNGST